MSSPQETRRHELAQVDDARSRRTRRQLVTALLAELAESPDSVSVARVIERAGVGRSTFYTHYSTLERLAERAIDDVFEDLPRRDVERRRGRLVPKPEITRLGLDELLAGVLEFADLISTVGGTGAAMRERVTAHLGDAMREILALERPEVSGQSARDTCTFVAGGVARVLFAWVDDGKARVPAREVRENLYELLPEWLTG